MNAWIVCIALRTRKVNVLHSDLVIAVASIDKPAVAFVEHIIRRPVNGETVHGVTHKLVFLGIFAGGRHPGAMVVPPEFESVGMPGPR